MRMASELCCCCAGFRAWAASAKFENGAKSKSEFKWRARAARLKNMPPRPNQVERNKRMRLKSWRPPAGPNEPATNARHRAGRRLMSLARQAPRACLAAETKYELAPGAAGRPTGGRAGSGHRRAGSPALAGRKCAPRATPRAAPQELLGPITST